MVREIIDIDTGRVAQDGAGVKLTRIFGGNKPRQYDPFLMLDEFGSNQPNDYLAGFPEHPHRGFEAVSYLLEGRMRHQDSLGNQGLLESGDVQWLTAGQGVIHSEMPEQKQGRLHGFQLWINLPKAEKMKPAAYRDIPAQQIPQHRIDGIDYKLIAGQITLNQQMLEGAVIGQSSQPVYLDIHFNQPATTQLTIDDGLTTLLYLFEGSVQVGNRQQDLNKGQLAQLTTDGDLVIKGQAGSRLILLAGKPLNEPVAQYGPFVMNTPEEIQQAIEDYRNGQLTTPQSQMTQ
jgi:redox-sensitive bicupin YhaK (pirin superfamily)